MCKICRNELFRLIGGSIQLIAIMGFDRKIDNPGQIVESWISRFQQLVDERRSDLTGELFESAGFWRDILAFTWDLRTFCGPEEIYQALDKYANGKGVGAFSVEGDAQTIGRKQLGTTIEAFLNFRTQAGPSRGHLRLRQSSADGKWKAWTFLTSLEDLHNFPEQAGPGRPRYDEEFGHWPGGRKPETEPFDSENPAVAVLGAGQAGLMVAARLQAFGVNVMVVERNERIGDNWRNRYQSLVLHNQIWGNRFPYLDFPDTWPIYLTKHHMANWLEHYASLLALNVRTCTRVTSARYDAAGQHWELAVNSGNGDRIIHPRHIVQATGLFDIVNEIPLPGEEHFTGLVFNAEAYRGQLAETGRRVLVVGTGSSGHDVAQDLCESGADVTILQRSSTCVVSIEPGAARAYSIYAEDGIPTDDADLVSNSYPLLALAELHRDLTKRIAELDRELLDGLINAGFEIDFGEDGSGFLMKYHRYGGGYYVNVGCSDLIVSGKIKVKQGVEIEQLTGNTVIFSDGTREEYDGVIVAAGYKNMSESVRAIMGDDVADKVGPIWGLDNEGEVRGMWRRTGQPGFWLMGGSLQQCRPFSKYLALQIKASEVGLLPRA
jgi:cation diffusion facilitator CzcD-associated flavoprotein CzcO